MARRRKLRLNVLMPSPPFPSSGWIGKAAVPVLFLVLAGCSLDVQAAPQAVSRVIVKLRSSGERATQSAELRVAKLAADIGVEMVYQRPMALGNTLVTLFSALPTVDAAFLAARLRAHPDVVAAEPDYHRRWVDDPMHARTQPRWPPKLTPDDSLLGWQTYLDDSAGGIDAFRAWDITTGSPGTVIAVVDSGVTHHAELSGRTLPGYDFISNTFVANDGDGRDTDASDPGGWVTLADLGNPNLAGLNCYVRDSVWHGTAVSGIIAAHANNGQGFAGLNWVARIVPVRVWGKCDDGYDSDMLDGIAWAAGLPVPGVPINAYPAQIINMSGTANDPPTCNPLWQDAINQVFANGVTRAFVAAAGNWAMDVAEATPASCSGVIAVAATTRQGVLTDYSNYGPGILISAPGGQYLPGLPDTQAFISVLTDAGKTGPVRDAYATDYQGTSFSAPMVSGVISLMLAVAPALTAEQIRAILAATAKPFAATATNPCLAGPNCGAGILDAYAAVQAAKAPAPLNYEGLWWAAPAASESGWGINFAHQGDTIFATWFTYDLSGKGVWFVMTANMTAPGIYSGPLLQATGPAFDTVPFPTLGSPGGATGKEVGAGTLTFTDGNNATFAYSVGGIAQSKALTREIFGPLPVCVSSERPSFVTATNFQDLWWAAPAGSESGWGLNLTHQGDVIFASWFTYDHDHSPLWLIASAPKTGPRTYGGTLYRLSGPPFDAQPFPPLGSPAGAKGSEVGAATLAFTDGNTGTFSYSIGSETQSKAITRELFAPPAGTVCQ